MTHTLEAPTQAVAADDFGGGLDLSELLRMLGRYWAAILVCTLAGVAAAAGLAAIQPRQYTSDATAIVSAGISENVSLAFSADSLSKSKAAQYETLVGSRAVAERALEIAGIEASPQQATGLVTGTVPPDTAMLEVSVRWPDPAGAQALADAWVQALVEEVEDIENRGGTTTDGTGGTAATDGAVQSTITLSSMVPAHLPTAPSSPNLRMYLLLGAVIGLAAGAGYAMIRHQLDRRIRSSRALEDLGLPVIGTIPLSNGHDGEEGRLLAADEDLPHRGDFHMREAFKELRTNLQFMSPDRPPRIITITSALPGDGKSTVASNLAVSLAETGQRVLLVDADLRKPTVADTFGLVHGVGLSDVVVGRVEAEDVIVQDPRLENLSLLTAGPIPPNPAEILSSGRMKDLLEDLSRDYFVVLDAPPLLPVTDAAILAARFDGAIVVVRAEVTRKEELAKALDSLGKVKAAVIGGVLNRVPTGRRQSSYYAYYGHDYYRAPAADGSSRRRSSGKAGKAGTRTKRDRTDRARRRRDSGARAAQDGSRP